MLIVDVDASATAQIAERLKDEKLDAKALVLDITGEDAPTQIVQTALDWRGRIDGLINNAGTNYPNLIEQLSDADFDAIHELNVRAAYRLTRAAAEALRQSGGAIVNVSSIHARQPVAKFSAYAATKGAIEALTRALATELGGQGVRANCIVPGLVDGEQTRRVAATHVADVQQWFDDFAENNQCLRHIPLPEDVGQLAEFLLSSRSRAITGQCIPIDSGASVVLRI